MDAKIRAKNRGKKGVLVLSGKQCSLGVTIDDCDIVLLLNNSHSYDLVFQMMFRCMTEGEKKKRGFVIDLNIHRIIGTILMQYGSTVKPKAHPKDAIRYLLQERLISLNSDHWMPCFGHGVSQLTALTNTMYDIYSSKMSGALENLFKRMSLKLELFSKNEYDMMKSIFHNLDFSNECKDQLLEEFEKMKMKQEERLKKGIETFPVATDQKLQTDNLEKEEEVERIDPIEILRPMSIVISLLTIHDNDKTTLEEMFSLVENNEKKKAILFDQVRVWWGRGVTGEDVERLIWIFRRYLEKDKETMGLIRQVKELFSKNIRNARELSKIIDQYLIPQENEKKKNAEVSTPYPLRQEMLETLPSGFWTKPQKVFEPCCGKGGFLLDIIDKFMTGLRDTYPEETQRYKLIVEECLYWSDINEMNIFICRLLLDPYNEYSLNYNVGDTLELDVEKKWGLELRETTVLGNPPYSTNPSLPNTTPLYDKFILKYLEARYLLFVVPSRWFLGGKGLDPFRKHMLARKDIRLIQHEDNAKKWFGNGFQIEGGVNYFLVDNRYTGKCLFNGVEYDLSRYDGIVKPEHHQLIDKVLPQRKLIERYRSAGYFKVRTNDKRLKTTGKIKCFVSVLKSKDRVKYLDEFIFTEKNSFWKVITAEANGNRQCFGSIFIVPPHEIYTDSYISFYVADEQEGLSLKTYLETPIINKILSIRKISQHITTEALKWIPLVPLDRKWTDEKVREYLGLKKNEFD